MKTLHYSLCSQHILLLEVVLFQMSHYQNASSKAGKLLEENMKINCCSCVFLSQQQQRNSDVLDEDEVCGFLPGDRTSTNHHKDPTVKCFFQSVCNPLPQFLNVWGNPREAVDAIHHSVLLNELCAAPEDLGHCQQERKTSTSLLLVWQRLVARNRSFRNIVLQSPSVTMSQTDNLFILFSECLWAETFLGSHDPNKLFRWLKRDRDIHKSSWYVEFHKEIKKQSDLLWQGKEEKSLLWCCEGTIPTKL